MVRVEQTEFWSDVEIQSPGTATTAFTRGEDPVYVDETVSLADWFVNGDESEADDAEAPAEAASGEAAGSAPVEATRSLPERPRATPPRTVYADTSAPRFNMARFLTLTGSLDAVEDEGRWLALPRNPFRARVMLDTARRISQDFLRDLRSPPRSYSIHENRRPGGWLKV